MSETAGSHQIVLILDDDLLVTAGLSLGLERPNRTIVTCNDLESAELAVEWLKPSHVVSDVRLTGPFAYEGLDFIHFVKRHAPDARVILMTGEVPDALQLEASERGAVGFLRKPFEVAELDATLDLLAPHREGSADWPGVVRVPMLGEILVSESLTTEYQPIVGLTGRIPLGFEALTRFASDSFLRNPDLLFAYAARKRKVAELEVACVRSSVRRGAALARSYPLFLNVHPSVFAAGDVLLDALSAVAEEQELGLDRVVLEITEQSSLGDRWRVLDATEKLKAAGVRFAFDDVGVAYSHLPFIDAVRPAFLKVSQHFGTNFEEDATKTKLVRNLLSLARDFDSELILEGIESEATAQAALEMGIRYGQGFFFARPAPAGTWMAEGRAL